MTPYMWLRKWLVGPVLRRFYEVESTGLENLPADSGVIIIANHQKAVDPLLVAITSPRQISFAAKSGLFKHRLYYWFMHDVIEQFPVTRGGGRDDQAAFNAEAQTRVADGRIVGIFPEGTRTPGGRLHRFKTGATRAALAAGCSVVPIGIVYTPRRRQRTLVKITVGQPINYLKPAGELDYQSVNNLTKLMTEAVKELTGLEYIHQYAYVPPER